MKLEQLSGRQKDLLAVTCLALLTFLIYGNTYNVTWHLDDFASIITNKNVYALADPLRTLLSPRGPALLSFALNYALHGESLPGYHLFNNGIHIMASAIVYLLLKRVTGGNRSWAFIGALVFATHPLQTQAVTYIVQRMAALAALFAFTCLYCYVRGRETLAGGKGYFSLQHVGWYLAMFIFCTLAILTKQNTAFLPFGLYVFGRYFLDTDHGWGRRRSITYLAPFMVLPILVAIPILIAPLLRGVPLSVIGATGGTASPLRYFVSEWQVLLLYIRLLFVPYGQMLDYGYPLVAVLVSATTILYGSLVAALMYAAYRVRHSARLVSFAIIWFFLSLAVESSFIPLDLVFEHRLYIPMFGFTATIIWLLEQVPRKRYGFTLATVLIAVYCLLTFQRNALWADSIALYEDNLRKQPLNERMYIELSRCYIETKQYRKAETLLKTGLTFKPRSAFLHDNLGTLYNLMGEKDRAVEIYKRGLVLAPDYEKLYINLAVVYSSRFEFPQAQELLLKALAINPSNAAAHANLGGVYYMMQNRERALESYRTALAYSPSNADIIFYLTITAFETGNSVLARSMLARLESLDAAKAAEIRRHFR